MDKMELYYKSPFWLQNILISCGKYFENKKILKYSDEIYKELEKSQYYSESDLKELQLMKLKALIKSSYENVQYYNELFNENKISPSDIKSLEDISIVPYLTKDIVRNNYSKLINTNYKPQELFHNHTSGTTGSPLHFQMDLYTQSFYQAQVKRHRSWFGYEYDEYCASFGGKEIVKIDQNKMPLWRYSVPDKLIIFSSLHLRNDIIHEYIEYIKRKGIQYIKGYPSNLYVLAKYLEDNDTYLPMKGVFTGSEPLYPHILKLIKERFKSNIGDFYGNSELTTMAYNCPINDGYHIAMENVYLEILKSDDNMNDNEYGEIISTSLTNVAMPFIRYKSGDYSRILNRECSCGRKLQLLDKVETKLEDIVVMHDGRLLSPSALTHPFKNINPKAINKSQIVQTEKGTIIIKIVKGKDFSELEIKRLVDNFNNRFSKNLVVNITFVDDLPKEKSGKFRWVISSVKK